METSSNLETLSRPKSSLGRFAVSRWCTILAATLAVVLSLPSIRSGIMVDDYHMKNLMEHPEHPYNFANSPLDIFNFMGDDPEKLKMMKSRGLPWWTDDDAKAAFWRPLSSATHWLDYLLFSGEPAIMHLHSILWYAGCAGLIAVYYRRLMGAAAAAGIAAILWAIDDGHGTPVGFISNRNALIACFFGAAALIFYDMFCKEKKLSRKVGALVSLALSLLSAEAGIATCAYLFAYAVFIEAGTWRKKVLNLLPFVSVVVLWRIVWTVLGYGTRNIGLYVDPVREPAEFLSAMPEKMVLLGGSLMTGLSADISLMVGEKGKMILIACELVLLAVIAIAFFSLLKKDKIARFWLTGTLLAMVPSCATFACDRLMVFASIGAMGLMGQFLVFVFGNKEFCGSKPVLKGVSIAVAAMLLTVNAVLSPAGLVIRAKYPLGPGELTAKAFIPEIEDEQIVEQDLIVVNPPSTFLAMCSPYLLDADIGNKPGRIWLLCSSIYGPTEVIRIDEYSISVRPTRGYMAFALDRLFWNEKEPMEIGKIIRLEGMEVEIAELTADGRAALAVFRFDNRLEDESYRWLKWGYGYYEPYSVPRVGESEVIKAGTLRGGIKQLIKR